VHDSQAPPYTNNTCKYIQEHQDCMMNGRPDQKYLYWRWKPNKCELPRIDSRTALDSMRGKSMVFVGDSIARNQFQALLCALSQAFLSLSFSLILSSGLRCQIISLLAYSLLCFLVSMGVNTQALGNCCSKPILNH
jgi:hypothetical protein